MLKNINATINADSTNLAPIGVAKVEDTLLLNLKVITAAGELIDFTGQDIYISALRSNNSLVQQESFISVEKEAITIQLNKEFNALAGITQMELTARDSVGITTTANFYIRVNSRIMSVETIKATGYIDTLEKVKLEFLEELNVIKDNFAEEKETVFINFAEEKDNKLNDFTVQTQTAIDNFIERTNTVIAEFNTNTNKELEEINKKAQDNINIAINNFNAEFNKVAAEFNVNATREIDNFKTESVKEIEIIKVNADNTNLNAIDKFNTTNAEFNINANATLNSFNAEANKQLQEQKIKFDTLINEQKITEWEERLSNLEKHHEPVPVTTEAGEYILTESGVIMLKESEGY